MRGVYIDKQMADEIDSFSPSPLQPLPPPPSPYYNYSLAIVYIYVIHTTNAFVFRIKK